MAGRFLTTEQKVRKQTKQITYSERGVLQVLGQEGTFDEFAKVRGVSPVVRVIVRARGNFPESWAMAILFKNERIDGIDWEKNVRDHRGEAFDCSGWHRHIWKHGDANKNKECLPKFSPTTRRDFVLEGFKILKVKLGRSEHNDGQLFLDQAGTS